MLYRILRFHTQDITDFTIKLLIQLILLCTLAPMAITAEGMMPITLQSLIILFGAIAFGWRVGFLGAFLYVAMGLAGLPVFADYASGIDKLYGPYGGYFFGFMVAALITGYLTELDMFANQITAILLWFLGHMIILACGLFWTTQMGKIGWWEELQFLFPAAVIKSVLGALVIHLFYKIAQRFIKTT